MSETGSRDELKVAMSGAESAPAVARLCYVDDSRTSAYVVRRLLQPYGYQVDHFSSAEPAFVALIQEDYDLLLTDLKVSSTGMDGDDLIRILRKSGHPKISTMPIIVITGATDPQMLVDVYDAGANQVMKKPVDADELDGHIRRLLFDARRIAFDAPSEGKRRAMDATVVTLPTAHRSHPIAEPPVADNQLVADDAEVPVSSPAPESVNPVEPAEMAESALLSPSPEIQTKTEKETEPMPAAFSAEELSDEKEVPQAAIVVETVVATPQALPVSEAAEFQTDARVTATEKIDSPPEPTVDHYDNGEPVIIEPDMRAGKRDAGFGRSADENILQDLNQYALVVSERPGLFARSGVVNLLYSLVELVGIRKLLVRTLIVGVALTLLTVGWTFYFNQGLAVETAFVESGEIFQSITVPGRLVSKQRINVSAARSGRLTEVLVKEGDRVAKGQVLAKLDDRELLSRLRRAEANLKSAREGITLAERSLKRLRKANASGAVARRFVEDAEVDLRTARTNAGISVEEVRSATLDFDNQKVTAAFAGTVTSRFAEIGQWVGPAETLFTLVDETQREIEVRVDSADSVAIDVGQVVAVSSDAFPGLEWKESVVRLGTATDNKSNANSVKVYISLGNDAPTLRIGQQVDADIRTAWNPNTLKIPFEALISRDGQTMVAVLADGRVRMKTVETGIEDFAMAEIKQGLNEGEMVILSKGTVLHNGDKVHPMRDGE
jgi:RND family efflux transporter MFP subunit